MVYRSGAEHLAIFDTSSVRQRVRLHQSGLFAGGGAAADSASGRAAQPGAVFRSHKSKKPAQN
jgi:hypothetical protein